jgi:hypothetical protein
MPDQVTAPASQRTESFRHDRQTIAKVFDAFSDPDHPQSQRCYAHEHGIPSSTLNDWLNRKVPADCTLEDGVVTFFRSSVGQRFLRRLVLALLVVFRLLCPCGLRPVQLFLRHSGLSAFVASSYGALYDLDQTVQEELCSFESEERSRLAESMQPKPILVCADENFRQGPPCLIAVEPHGGFILAEAYKDHRDSDTWTALLQQSTADLPVTVVLLVSDQASGLVCCAKEGLQVPHAADLFHGRQQFRLLVMPGLGRPISAARKHLEKKQQQIDRLEEAFTKAQAGQQPKKPTDFVAEMLELVRDQWQTEQELKEHQDRREQAAKALRDLADAYHPFSMHTGAPVQSEEAHQKMSAAFSRLEQLAQEGQLPEEKKQELSKASSWLGLWSGCVAWFWTLTESKVEELDLSEEAERLVCEKPLGGLYWQEAARRARTADERKRLEEMAERLLQEAWSQQGALARMAEEKKEQVKRVARQQVCLFGRSSSCVEGRNGRLSLFRHGQTRLDQDRLNALTAAHNYLAKRADGSTAAERFFQAKQRDAFSWLLLRMPDLPRPAAKRPNQGRKSDPNPA